MNEDEWEYALYQYSKTSGYKKFKNYIREIFESNYFQDFTSKMRKKYQIPNGGFDLKEGHAFPPVAWIFRNNVQKRKTLNKEIKEVCKKYKIHYLDGLGIFENYIFYNETDYAIDFGGYGVCMTLDIPEETDLILEQAGRRKDAEYPIAILISPYASLRDIIDYIKFSYKYSTSFLQKKYKNKNIKLGKFKKRKNKIQERNDFIYKNRHLPRKEIMHLVAEKFGGNEVIDFAYIGKIISLENKRRTNM